VTAASRITVPTHVADGAPWFGHLRLVLVIDQAMTPARP